MCRASHPPQRARRNCCRKRTCSAGERSMTIREGTAGTRTTPKGGTSRCSKRPVRCATTHPITVRCSMWNDLAADKLSELKQTVELRRTVGLSAALTVVQTGHGNQVMERIRALISTLEKNVDADATAKSREVTNRARNAALMTSAASLTLFTLFAAAGLQL